MKWARWMLMAGPIAAFTLLNTAPLRAQISNYEFNDSHFHLTNSKTGRVALFGVPLQQQWSYRVDTLAKDGSEPAYLNQIKAVFKRHPNATII